MIASGHRLFGEVVAEALHVVAPEVSGHVVDDLAGLAAAVACDGPVVVVVDEDFLGDLDEGFEFDGLRVLLLASDVDGDARATARRRGWHGVVGREARLVDLRRALLADDPIDFVVVGNRSRGSGRRPTPRGLTPRELEVIELLARGADNAAIAEQLSITHNTVRTHVQNLFAKLDVSSRLAAVSVAIQTGMVAVPRPRAEWSADGLHLPVKAEGLEQPVTEDRLEAPRR